MKSVKIGNKLVGEENPVYIIAEIGLNHNGDMANAKKLIDIAANTGCDAVKFQKRTPEDCVPLEQRSIMRETPWGIMSYMDYRYKVELDYDDYEEINFYCHEKGIHWFASSWDFKSIDFIERFNPPCHKIPSAMITNHSLLKAYAETNKTLIMSTGMSSFEEIKDAIDLLDSDKLLLLHCTSTYPCPLDQLNLRMLNTLRKKFDLPIGYSGHEVGLSPTYAAVALGACVIERHITLDRAMWGSDQSASIEPGGLRRLVENIRNIETALGDGIKQVYDEELIARKKLRFV